MNNSSNNWYDNPKITAERAVLIKAIEFKTPKDTVAEFFIPIFTPTIDTSDGIAKNEPKAAPNLRTSAGKLSSSGYTSANNISLTIPKYIMYQFYDPYLFTNYIAEGTEFIVTSIGEQVRLENMKIIGIYKTIPPKNKAGEGGNGHDNSKAKTRG